MKFFLGVTDNRWYKFLSQLNREDINFWQPGGNSVFKILEPGAPFLFKLKTPINKIGGVGFFSSHTFLPLNIAWDVFRDGNGCMFFSDFKQMILDYRSDKQNTNPNIGCIVLTNPVFFKPQDWIDLPIDWSKNIVQGKSYDTESIIGKELWEKVETTLDKYLYKSENYQLESQLLLQEDSNSRYRKDILTKVRLGQGAFRILVTDAYTRRCAISGEKTLPVLEAAHIQSFAQNGPHLISNGLLLRSDLHKLFDSGYVTITKDYKVEVSNRIREEFENGREYYRFHGSDLQFLPGKLSDRPKPEFIEWHNNQFKS